MFATGGALILTRLELKRIGATQRFLFQGTFKKYGFKYTTRYHTHAAPTILLVDISLVTDDGLEPLTSHLSFNLTKGFKHLGHLLPGDELRFFGRVSNYTKGYQGNNTTIHKPLQVDYKIQRPTKVELLTKTGPARREWTGANWENCLEIYDLYRGDYQARGIPQPY